MRLKRLLFLLAVCAATCAEAQDLKIMVNDKGKVGFADQNGNEVIKCEYESAQPFARGVSIVSKSEKFGIIDTQGKVLLPLKYSQIMPWTDDLFVIKDGKKMGLANYSGTVVLPVEYSQISKPNCYDKALIAKGGKSTPYEKCMYQVYQSSQQSALRKELQKLNESATPENEAARNALEKKLDIMQMEDASRKGKSYMEGAAYGIIDSKGNVILEAKQKTLREFSLSVITSEYSHFYHEGMMMGDNFHFTADTLVTDCSYIGYGNYNKPGIMDASGNIVVKEKEYDVLMKPKGNMIRYYIIKKENRQCGYINTSTGKAFQVCEFNINNLVGWTHGDFTGDIAPVNTVTGNAPWKFIDKNGNDLRTGYTYVKHSIATGLWAAKNDAGKWEVFDDSNNEISSISGYEDINFPVHAGDADIYSVKKDGKFGCINRAGAMIVPFQYDNILGNCHDVIAVQNNKQWGAVSVTGNTIIPTSYAKIVPPAEKGASHLWVQEADSLYYHYNVSSSRLSAIGYKKVYNYVNGAALVIPTNMKVDDTPVNRAQTYMNNTDMTTEEIDKAFARPDQFGYLIDTNDVVIFDRPVTSLYKEKVLKVIAKYGNRPLTESEKKNIILTVTSKNRSYDLQSTINSDEWNY